MTAPVGSLVVHEESVVNTFPTYLPVVRMGMISYGIYLLHLIGLDIAVRITRVIGLSQDGMVTALLYVAFSILLAEISFRSYESYCLEMRHKPLGRLWNGSGKEKRDA